MTLKKPELKDGSAQEFVRAAAEHYGRALAAFEKSTDRYEAGVEAPSPETDKVLRQFRSATEILLKGKQKLEDCIKKDTGIVYDYAIDFDSAREEIRRRLACLRRAAITGEVSE